MFVDAETGTRSRVVDAEEFVDPVGFRQDIIRKRMLKLGVRV